MTNRTAAPADARRDLANTIAQQAEALATAALAGGASEYVQVARLLANVETLRAWTPDDRPFQ